MRTAVLTLVVMFGLNYSQAQTFTLKNFSYIENGVRYYVLPKENASTLDLWARKGIAADSISQLTTNKLASYLASNLFLNARLDELMLNNGKTSTEMRKITKDYNLLASNLAREKIRGDEYKAKYKKARNNLYYVTGGIAAALLLIILVQ